MWLPTYLQHLADWIKNPNVYQYGRWNNPPSAFEGGVDYGSGGGTPVYALADGPIQGAGDFWHPGGNPGYGVVSQRVNVPGYGLQDIYYQHIAISPSILTCNTTGGNLYGGKVTGKCTQMLHKGDLIGTIRPNVGMLEVGFNANWGGVWGSSHPGPWSNDPRPMIKALLDSGPPTKLGGQPTMDTTGFTGSTGTTGTPINLGGDLVNSLMGALGLPNAADVQSFTQRMGLIFFGGMIILIGLLIVFLSSDTGKKALTTGAKAAAA